MKRQTNKDNDNMQQDSKQQQSENAQSQLEKKNSKETKSKKKVIILLVVIIVFLLIVYEQFGEIKSSRQKIELFPKQKENFFKRFGEHYGYNGQIYDLREKEFGRFEDHVYLDYTAAGQFQVSQVTEQTEFLSKTLYNNPHSRNPSSSATDERIREIRKLILSFFNTNKDEYSVVFTSGATGALKIISESFPWQPNSEFWYTLENHNSVLGIREVALDNQVPYRCFNDDEINKKLEDAEKGKIKMQDNSVNLFAFPAECNFSGSKQPLEWIEKFHNTKNWGKNVTWLVILDAAAYVPTNKLDLSKYQPDFVSISFYKMFGWPTGIGALIVKNEHIPLLAIRKHYFGGGTVTVATGNLHFHQRPKEACYTSFEDGTPSFLSIFAIKNGLQKLEEIGINNISEHVYVLTRYLYEELSQLKHDNGKQVIEIYGNFKYNDKSRQGGIIAINIRDVNGNYFGYYQLQNQFSEAKIHVRTGCFCNPGACYSNVGQREEKIIDLAKYRTTCGDEIDIFEGRPTGAIRISLGYPTTFEDVQYLIEFLRNTYTNKIAPKPKTVQLDYSESNSYMDFFQKPI